MKSFLRALGNVFLTFLVMLLVVYGWAYIEMKILLKSQPELFGFAFYMQESGDMIPEFEENDIILVKKGAEYKSGDIVLYFDGKDSTYKVHRVISLDGDNVVTKCDQCSSNNQPVSTNNVYGRAVGKVMVLGNVVKFFKKKSVLITIAVVGLLFIVLSQIMEFRPKKKKEEEIDASVQDENISDGDESIQN